MHSFKENLGMGAGNNLGIRYTDKDYALILNPDVILQKNTIDEIINASKKIDNFGVISPISDNQKYPNYKFIIMKIINLIKLDLSK
jgi:N-acetylglucosaminyl-diphospho-decaprenol L-rhamnosyltransferase